MAQEQETGNVMRWAPNEMNPMCSPARNICKVDQPLKPKFESFEAKDVKSRMLDVDRTRMIHKLEAGRGMLPWMLEVGQAMLARMLEVGMAVLARMLEDLRTAWKLCARRIGH